MTSIHDSWTKAAHRTNNLNPIAFNIYVYRYEQNPLMFGERTMCAKDTPQMNSSRRPKKPSKTKKQNLKNAYHAWNKVHKKNEKDARDNGPITGLL